MRRTSGRSSNAWGANGAGTDRRNHNPARQGPTGRRELQLNKRQFLAGSAAFAGSVHWAISARAAGDLITVSHSVNTTIYAAHMVAQAKGFAEAEGLDMRVIEAQGGSNVRKILAAGQVGYALGDSSHPLQLTNRGRPSKILMATDNRCSYANIVVRKELYDQGIDSVEKLAEYKRDGSEQPIIAATGIGSGTWVYGTYVLETKGVADKFNWVAGGGSKTMLGGLQAGKFDAIMAVPAWMFEAEDAGYGKVIYDVSDADSWGKVFGGNIPATVVYVLDEAITDNAETTQKYVNAMYKSMQWMGTSSVDEIAEVVGPLMPGFDTGAKVWFRELTKIEKLDYAAVTDMSFLENAKKA